MAGEVSQTRLVSSLSSTSQRLYFMEEALHRVSVPALLEPSTSKCFTTNLKKNGGLQSQKYYNYTIYIVQPPSSDDEDVKPEEGRNNDLDSSKLRKKKHTRRHTIPIGAQKPWKDPDPKPSEIHYQFSSSLMGLYSRSVIIK